MKKWIELIKDYEGFYSKPYLCPAGVPTIGYGTIVYPNGKKVTLKDPPCTVEQATEWFIFEAMDKLETVKKLVEKVGLSLTEEQLGAITSLCYNVGIGCLDSNKTFGIALRSKSITKIADAFLVYNKARVGIFRRLKVLRGLVRRRESERNLFLSGE